MPISKVTAGVVTFGDCRENHIRPPIKLMTYHERLTWRPRDICHHSTVDTGPEYTSPRRGGSLAVQPLANSHHMPFAGRLRHLCVWPVPKTEAGVQCFPFYLLSVRKETSQKGFLDGAEGQGGYDRRRAITEVGLAYFQEESRHRYRTN